MLGCGAPGGWVVSPILLQTGCVGMGWLCTQAVVGAQLVGLQQERLQAWPALSAVLLGILARVELCVALCWSGVVGGVEGPSCRGGGLVMGI
jgi:hypothetical protein